MDVVAAFTLAKTAIDLAKGMSSLTKQAEIAATAIELQQIIMNLQQKFAEAASANDQMAREIRDLKDELKAKADLKRYQLVGLPGGAKVYGLPQTQLDATGELSHFLCPTCYAQGKKLVLQGSAESEFLNCNDCKNFYRQRPATPLSKRRRTISTVI
ncbi:hypothetical protein [Cupriavidus sp. PET2-C1]